MICPHCHGRSLTALCFACGGSGYVSEPATDTTTDADPWAEIARLEGRVRELEAVAEVAVLTHRAISQSKNVLMELEVFWQLDRELRAAGYLKEVKQG